MLGEPSDSFKLTNLLKKYKQLEDEYKVKEAEVARLRQVYEAAVEWVRQWDRYMVPDDSGEVRHPEEPDEEPLIKAVREARDG